MYPLPCEPCHPLVQLSIPIPLWPAPSSSPSFLSASPRFEIKRVDAAPRRQPVIHCSRLKLNPCSEIKLVFSRTRWDGMPLLRQVHRGDGGSDLAQGQHAAVGPLHLGRQLLHAVRGGGVPPDHVRPGPPRRDVDLFGESFIQFMVLLSLLLCVCTCSVVFCLFCAIFSPCARVCYFFYLWFLSCPESLLLVGPSQLFCARTGCFVQGLTRGLSSLLFFVWYRQWRLLVSQKRILCISRVFHVCSPSQVKESCRHFPQ